jgi:hypothetical protein
MYQIAKLIVVSPKFAKACPKAGRPLLSPVRASPDAQKWADEARLSLALGTRLAVDAPRKVIGTARV